MSPFEEPPAGASEVISCSWDGELIGSLAIGIPDEMADEEPREEPAGHDSEPETDLPPRGEAEISRETVPETVPETIPEPKEISELQAKKKASRRAKKTASGLDRKKEAGPAGIKQQEAVPGASGPFGKPLKKKISAKKKSGSETKRIPKREITAIPLTEEDIENDEALLKLEIEESFDNPSNLTRLNKNAARKAYGGAGARKAVTVDGGKKEG
jgi:hypothetical protein